MHTVLFYCVLILICVFSGFVGSLFSYSSGLLQCHWGNCNCPNASKRNMNARDNILQKKYTKAKIPCIHLGMKLRYQLSDYYVITFAQRLEPFKDIHTMFRYSSTWRFSFTISIQPNLNFPHMYPSEKYLHKCANGRSDSISQSLFVW